MRTLAVLTFGALLLGSPASAETAAGTVTILGVGLESCGAWTNRPRPEMAVWVFGFISRATIQNPGNILGKLDADALDAWMTNYCKDHPLEPIARGAQVLERELVSKATPPKAKP